MKDCFIKLSNFENSVLKSKQSKAYYLIIDFWYNMKKIGFKWRLNKNIDAKF